MQNPKVQISLVDKTLPMPKYETSGSVGFDLYAREETTIKPKEIALIPSNIICKVPDGYMLAVVSRSSTPRKKGLLKPHAIGVIDQDYCGQTDEILLQVYNFTDQDIVISKLDRIAQGIFLPVLKANFVEFNPQEQNRGGFGSTG